MRFIRLPEVIERTGLARSTIYLGVADGTFPKQISIGARAVAWLESDIEDWIRSKIDTGKYNTTPG